MPACKSCNADIVWAKTVNLRTMPLDAAPSSLGNMVLINGVTRTATEEDRRLLRPLHTSHFATCPDASRHRKPR